MCHREKLLISGKCKGCYNAPYLAKFRKQEVYPYLRKVYDRRYQRKLKIQRLERRLQRRKARLEAEWGPYLDYLSRKTSQRKKKNFVSFEPLTRDVNA